MFSMSFKKGHNKVGRKGNAHSENMQKSTELLVEEKATLQFLCLPCPLSRSKCKGLRKVIVLGWYLIAGAIAEDL